MRKYSWKSEDGTKLEVQEDGRAHMVGMGRVVPRLDLVQEILRLSELTGEGAESKGSPGLLAGQTLEGLPALDPDVEIRLRCLDAAVLTYAGAREDYQQGVILEAAIEFEAWVRSGDRAVEDAG